MAYVAPTWRNGGPPALDAAALQAISDAIVGAESKNASQDSLITALQTAVSALQSDGAKIEVGSYVGTGTYGSSNPNSITFSSPPKLVWLVYAVNKRIASNGGNINGWSIATISTRSDFNNIYVKDTWPTDFRRAYFGFWDSQASYSYGAMLGNTLSWYNIQGAAQQCNSLGSGNTDEIKTMTYYWIAVF